MGLFDHAVAKEEYQEGIKEIKEIKKTLKDRQEAFDMFRSRFYDFYWKHNKYLDYYETKENLIKRESEFFNAKKLETENQLSEINYLINQLRRQVSEYEQWKTEQAAIIQSVVDKYVEMTEALNTTTEFLHNQQQNEVKRLENALRVREKTGRQDAFNQIINYLIKHFDMDRDELIEALKVNEDD